LDRNKLILAINCLLGEKQDQKTTQKQIETRSNKEKYEKAANTLKTKPQPKATTY